MSVNKCIRRRFLFQIVFATCHLVVLSCASSVDDDKHLEVATGVVVEVSFNEDKGVIEYTIVNKTSKELRLVELDLPFGVNSPTSLIVHIDGVRVAALAIDERDAGLPMLAQLKKIVIGAESVHSGSVALSSIIGGVPVAGEYRLSGVWYPRVLLDEEPCELNVEIPLTRMTVK